MPPPAVPATPTEGGKKKITLKIPGKSQPSTPITDNPPTRTPLPGRTPLPAKPPAAETPAVPLTTTKAGRTSKPSARKRAQDDDTDEEEEANANKLPPQKRPKVSLKKTRTDTDTEKDQDKDKNSSKERRNSKRPIIVPKDRLTTTGQRTLGSGFDSEMEDLEEDPIIEEEIVLRMMEGPECDYVNECLNTKKFPSGGMDFKLKWVDERRAAVTVRNQLFAGVLVDLPTVTEATKTWDKKLVVKSADICQMLLVFKKITREDEAKTAELPKVIFDGYRWPHGLTPPMHDAVHRRFRKRLNKTEIATKEQEVERLLKADKAAISTKYEFVGERRGTMQIDTPHADINMLEADGEEDAEGELEDVELGVADTEDHFEPVDPDFEAEMERVLDMDAVLENDSGMDTPGQTDATPAAPVDTPAAGAGAGGTQGDDNLFGDDESGEDYDDDDEDSDEDLDPAEKERREQIRGVREELRDIDRNVEKLEGQLTSQHNPLLRQRLQARIKGLKEDKRLKMISIGEVADEDEEED